MIKEHFCEDYHVKTTLAMDTILAYSGECDYYASIHKCSLPFQSNMYFAAGKELKPMVFDFQDTPIDQIDTTFLDTYVVSGNIYAFDTETFIKEVYQFLYNTNSISDETLTAIQNVRGEFDVLPCVLQLDRLIGDTVRVWSVNRLGRVYTAEFAIYSAMIEMAQQEVEKRGTNESIRSGSSDL